SVTSTLTTTFIHWIHHSIKLVRCRLNSDYQISFLFRELHCCLHILHHCFRQNGQQELIRLKQLNGNNKSVKLYYMNNTVLKANKLIKSYQTAGKQKIEVLKSVSIEIESEKISVIVGASGAGKSTLLHLLSALDRPDSGEVFYDEQNIFKLSDDKLAQFRNKNIGFV